MVPEDSPARVLWRDYTPLAAIPEEPSSEESEEEATSVKQAAAFDPHVNTVLFEGLRMRTTDEAIASGLRAESFTTKKAKKREPFFGVSVYRKLFPGIISTIR